MLNYNDCEKIVKHNSSFIEKGDVINGYLISQYSYRLANFSDFLRPLTSNSIEAFEMRGICFVHKNNNNLFDNTRYIMLNKFFNVNQTERWMYKDIKDKEIDYVQEKVDGSLIRFIRLPNDIVIAKTIYSFESEQAIEADKIYKSNENLRRFVDFTLDHNIAAMFEFTSPYNQIVVKYNNEDLKLLAMRRESDGKYFTRQQIEYYSKTYNISIAEFCDNLTLDEYIEKSKYETGIEGWVITFRDGQKVKVKTKWYLSLHRIMTSVINRENDIIYAILEGSSDDLIASLHEDDIENRNKVSILTSKVTNYLYNSADEIYSIIENNYKGNRKDFAIRFKENKFFSIMMKCLDLDYEKIVELVIEYIKKNTKNLYDAKKFIETELKSY
jgi:T4 RnlA family RNA ligase